MNGFLRLAGIVAALIVLALTMAGCDDGPKVGGKCKPGSYSTRVKDGHRTDWACNSDGVWRKTK